MKKIGIVTFNDADNYGAFLQEYALQIYLQNNGYHVEVINYQNKDFSQLYKYANNLIRRKGLKNKAKILYNMVFRPKTFIARLKKSKLFKVCREKEIILSEEFAKIENTIEEQYDYFIAGSDQVWNVRMTRYNLFYLLDFVHNPNKKLSYAASFGRTNFNEEDFVLFSQKLGNYSSVLVREESGKNLLLEKCGIVSHVVLDPTLLLYPYEWKRFSHNSNLNLSDRKYILIYVVSLPTFMYKAALNYAHQKELDIVLLGRNSGIKIDGKKIKATIDVGPYDFLNYIINAEVVFTTSFHGTILSINLEKPFFFELSKEQYNNNARLEDIIQFLGLQDREIISDIVEDCDIAWDIVRKRLDIERKSSKELLLKSIER